MSRKKLEVIPKFITSKIDSDHDGTKDLFSIFYLDKLCFTVERVIGIDRIYNTPILIVKLIEYCHKHQLPVVKLVVDLYLSLNHHLSRFIDNYWLAREIILAEYPEINYDKYYPCIKRELDKYAR